MQVIETSGVPVKVWVDGVQFEEEAQAQLREGPELACGAVGIVRETVSDR